MYVCMYVRILAVYEHIRTEFLHAYIHTRITVMNKPNVYVCMYVRMYIDKAQLCHKVALLIGTVLHITAYTHPVI
jgi:hypothetical protein